MLELAASFEEPTIPLEVSFLTVVKFFFEPIPARGRPAAPRGTNMGPDDFWDGTGRSSSVSLSSRPPMTIGSGVNKSLPASCEIVSTIRSFLERNNKTY